MDLTDESLALAREAVACKHWELLPGMLMDQRGLRVRYEDGALRELFAGDLPVFSDPATVGCLEALVQRVLGHDGASVVVEVRWTAGTHRVVRWRHRGPMGWSPTTIGGEAHPSAVAALVAALKAAP